MLIFPQKLASLLSAPPHLLLAEQDIGIGGAGKHGSPKDIYLGAYLYVVMMPRDEFVKSLEAKYGEIVSRRIFKNSDAKKHIAVEYSKIVNDEAVPVACLIV